jgi:hypothetical protein
MRVPKHPPCATLPLQRLGSDRRGWERLGHPARRIPDRTEIVLRDCAGTELVRAANACSATYLEKRRAR